jgi:Tfp pilus assembly protein PilX
MLVIDRMCGALRARLRDERGFTMLISLAVLVVSMLLIAATYVAVTGDTHLSRNDLDQKRAYAAAQAGIAQYTYQLNQNVNYWENCASSGATAVPNSADSGSSEYYSYSPLTASTSTSTTCSTSNAIGTMIEGTSLTGGGVNPAAGTFRITSTGWSGPTGTTLANCTPAKNCVARTIVAQYKRASFLNYVYYTDYETLDPAALYNASNNPTEPTDCAVHYPNRGNDCGQPINFIAGDVIAGPLHSEDTLSICASGTTGPIFGRSGGNDAIEAAGVSTEGQTGCTHNGSPSYTVNNSSGAINTTSTSLTPPPSNAQLLNVAQSGGVTYTGKTTIVLTGSTMTVNGTTGIALPSNGVIYVSTNSSGCGVNYTPFTANSDYTSDGNCGDVYISGTYNSSLTIASDNDIIIDGNLTTTSPSTTLLGLVANDFVRVYHQVTDRSGTTCHSDSTETYPTGTSQVNTIDAAILAVNHSFIVDNYDCGNSLGTLTVDGAIAQLFRGPVGTGSGGSTGTGYLKNYVYNDTLASIEPPYFLNPVSAAWHVQRSTECDASTC